MSHHRNYGLGHRRRPLINFDNNSPWPSRAFIVVEVFCVIAIGALVLALAGGLR
jgi:hypothetical protein